ncbi:MAG TPA: acyl carrier protein [Gammaproteobacteria bacterium]|nr:acyl carrier protein [Gammaproteobacteria bacterium]
MVTTVHQYLLENFLFNDPDQVIDGDQSLVGSGVIDSAAILSLIFFLEEEFDITVLDDEVVPENIDSLDLIAIYVEKKQANS